MFPSLIGSYICTVHACPYSYLNCYCSLHLQLHQLCYSIFGYRKICFLSSPSNSFACFVSATLQRSLRMTAYAAVEAFTRDREWDDEDNTCYHWCAHPCHPGREFYSISRAGCLRQLCFLLILFFVILACGWQCGCCAMVLACCCELLDDYDDY